MTRFAGDVGYGRTVESTPGVYTEEITEFKYFGEVTRNTRKLESGEGLNDDITVSNSISVVADAYARDHFFEIKYVRWAGVYWTVSSVEVKHPRLILTLGSVYNGPTA